ncbi:MAG: aminotransferase class IV [Pseudomonadota bacterium]
MTTGGPSAAEPDLSAGAAWVDGAVVPIAEATISVTDWGLTHSDATYDVAPLWEGAFFRLNDHLDRFEASMAALRLDIGMDRAAIRQSLHAIVAASGLRRAYVAMVATRGVPLISGTRDPRQCRNRYIAWCVPYVFVIKPEIAAAGAAIKIASTQRISDEAVDAAVKNYHWGDFTAGLMEAKDAGFETTLLLDAEGGVTEGPGFNIFAVKNGALRTPDRHCLRGITRRTVLEIAAEAGLPASEGPLTREELLEADEVFITTSGGGPTWIARIDDRIFGNGAEGAVTAQIRETYWRWITSRADLRDEVDYSD